MIAASDLQLADATMNPHAPIPEALTDAPETPEEVLAAINAGVAEHHAWLKSGHRALVCATPPTAAVLAGADGAGSPFAGWLKTHGGTGLLAQDAFAELQRRLERARELGKLLAERAAGGRRLPLEDYDALVEAASAFEKQASRLADAFRKAVAELDPLTGLANRVTMLRELETEFDRARRTGQPCGIALADLDRFKSVNDTHGHAVGDKVLAAAAGRFLSRLRPYDAIWRYGGEEFVICLPNADEPTALRILERLRDALAARPIPIRDDLDLPVTSSFGLAMVEGEVGLKGTIERADQALYAAKRDGRNRVSLWREGL